ncbi:unnamed protein product [Clonostachys chloroleuca]|uniref:Zn(2)-C6 fungal-type domain-containing protein n=1 Tax=Clonostachys chloroleuca TaxID=1926264 RepID=A0AA35Q0I4_9HYPO|nr:unnamed protein product [Clonostachys chloroleuca]
MSTKHRLRRSCAFCRARKIKCSNETICEACRRQGADCIYDFEPPRPKTRTSMDGTASPALNRGRSSTCGSFHESPLLGGQMTEEPFLADEIEDVATVLDRTFFQSFNANTVRATPRSRSRPDASHLKKSSILSLLSHDLVGLSASQLGSLGCSHLEDESASFFLSGLDTDETQNMFDNVVPATNPVTEYGQRQQTQLIDVWYSTHPLSFLVSKTLLLRELRDGTHDEILLAVMLADANFTIGSEASNARGHALLQYATSQLRQRPLQTTKNSGVATDSGTVVYSGISTRIFSGISTVQALMLLGWNALTSSQFRRAITYIQLAGRLATDLKEQVITMDGMQLSSRINGIDVYDVEKELIDHLYWTTYSLTLWAYVQTGRGYFSVSPTVIPTIMIPATEETSSSIQLDLISENVNTLQKQKSSIREMWALAHVSISIANACGFHPQQHGHSMAGPVHRCRDTSRFLMESINELNKTGQGASAASFVLVIYHTLAIQFLFPAQSEDSIMADVVERLCYSVEEILQIFAHASNNKQEEIESSLKTALPAAFGLAIDTCSRALQLINAQKASGALLRTFPSIQAYTPKLDSMTSRLYTMSKDDFLDQRSGLRAIRKQLKASMRGTSSPRSHSLSRSVSSCSETPSLSQAPSMSPAGSDFSSAPTPENDVQSVFVSPKAQSMAPQAGMGQMFVDNSMMKSAWRSNPAMGTAAPNDLMYNAMNPNALGIHNADDLSLAGMVDLQQAWLPQMPMMTEVDMGSVQWDWSQPIKPDSVPTGGWSDMDMVL